MRSEPRAPHRRGLAHLVLKLLGARRSDAGPAIGLSADAAHDDLSAMRCLSETYRNRFSECDCAEYRGPDGTLVWEQRAFMEAQRNPPGGELEGGPWSN